MAFEIFTQGFSFLNLISIIAFFTTVALFFCGIPICRQIWKRKDTKEIAAAPFLMGILGGTCWMCYGHLKNDSTVLVVTSTQVVLYSTYTIFYWVMTKKKLWISLQVLVILSLCGSISASTYYFQKKIFHPLGFLCMTLNAADFAAPLAGLRTVIRRGATSTLPLPLCIANFMVSTEWFIYGLLVKDFYLITPNGIGSVLALAQVLLFIVLPRKPGQSSPIRRLFDRIRRNGAEDLEAAAVVVVDKSTKGDLDPMERREREASWPARVISNLEQELDNVLSKVQAHEQFAYTQELDNEETDTESLGKGETKSAEDLPKVHDVQRHRCTTLRMPNDTPKPLTRSLSSPNL